MLFATATGAMRSRCFWMEAAKSMKNDRLLRRERDLTRKSGFHFFASRSRGRRGFARSGGAERPAWSVSSSPARTPEAVSTPQIMRLAVLLFLAAFCIWLSGASRTGYAEERRTPHALSAKALRRRADGRLSTSCEPTMMIGSRRQSKEGHIKAGFCSELLFFEAVSYIKSFSGVSSSLKIAG